MNRLTAQTAGGALMFRGTMSEPASVTVGGAPVGANAGNEFRGSATVPPGTSQVAIVATDASGNPRTNTYEVGQSSGGRTFTYDANGNLTSDGTRTYEWDANNKLVVARQNANLVASFTYDGTGRRSSKTGGGVTTTYVYDGQQFLEERSSQGPTKRYVYGPGIDRPLAQVSGGTVSYNVVNHLGSLVRTTDADGTATLARDYDPWGNLQGATTSGYAYTGREWDPEVGFYYFRSRYYDAAIGRFLSEDPSGSDELVTSLYSYVRGNPIAFSDPQGLDRQPDGSYLVPADLLNTVLAIRPYRFWGPTQQCASLVQELSGAPHTSLWRKGPPAFNNPDVKRGTAIATFDANGRYPQGKHKNSAIFLNSTSEYLVVLDQFPLNPPGVPNAGQPHPGQKRAIPNNPSSSPSDDAWAYSVILCPQS